MSITLEVGTVLYQGINKYVISRVTEKRAFVIRENVIGEPYEICFDREQRNSDFMNPRGSSLYSTSYQIESDELKERVARAKLLNYIGVCRFSCLKTEALIKISELIKEG
jgi:hypothetical protein